MADLGTLLTTLGVDMGPLERGVQDAERQFRKYQDSGVGAMQRVQRSVLDLKGTIIGLAASFGVFKFAEYIRDVTHLAGRYEELGIAMRRAGANAGYSSTEMDRLEKSLQKQGIAAIEARGTLTRMAAANIDLAKASQLARAAQDVAVVGAINSSEAFERMVHAIQSSEIKILRTIGLNVSLEQAYRKSAAALGKSVNELTEYEKLQARTNIVLEEATRYQGLYEQSMTSAEKQTRSMARHIDAYKIAVGEAFQPAYLEIVQKTTNMYRQLTEIFSDPKLQQSLGAIAKGFADMYTRIIELIPGLVRFIAESQGLQSVFFGLVDAVGGAWRILAAAPSGVVGYFSDLRAEVQKTTNVLNDLQPPDPSNWQHFVVFMTKWGRDTISVFEMVLKAVGEIFALMVTDAVSAVKIIASEFWTLGKVIYNALTLNFAGVKEAWNGFLTDAKQFNKEIENNFNAMTTSIGNSWAEMIKNMLTPPNAPPDVPPGSPASYPAPANVSNINAATAAILDQRDALSELLEELRFEQELLGKSEVIQRAMTLARQSDVEIGSEQYRQILDLVEANQRLEASFHIEEYIRNLERERNTIGMTNKELAIYELRQKGATEEQIRRVEAILDEINAIERAREERDRATREQERALEEMQEEYEHFFERIYDASADFFYDLLDKGKDSFRDFLDTIGDWFKRLLAEMAAQALMRPIIIPIVMGAAGTLGMGGVANAAMQRMGIPVGTGIPQMGGGMNVTGGIPGLGFLNQPIWGGTGSTSGHIITADGYIVNAPTTASGLAWGQGLAYGVGGGLSIYGGINNMMSGGNWANYLGGGAQLAGGGMALSSLLPAAAGMSWLGPAGLLLGGAGSIIASIFGGKDPDDVDLHFGLGTSFTGKSTRKELNAADRATFLEGLGAVNIRKGDYLSDEEAIQIEEAIAEYYDNWFAGLNEVMRTELKTAIQASSLEVHWNDIQEWMEDGGVEKIFSEINEQIFKKYGEIVTKGALRDLATAYEDYWQYVSPEAMEEMAGKVQGAESFEELQLASAEVVATMSEVAAVMDTVNAVASGDDLSIYGVAMDAINQKYDDMTERMKELGVEVDKTNIELARQVELDRLRRSVLISAYQSLLSMPDLTPEERWGFVEKGLEYKYDVDVTPEMIQQIYAELKNGSEEYILGLTGYLDSIGVPIEQFISDVVGANSALDDLEESTHQLEESARQAAAALQAVYADFNQSMYGITSNPEYLLQTYGAKYNLPGVTAQDISNIYNMIQRGQTEDLALAYAQHMGINLNDLSAEEEQAAIAGFTELINDTASIWNELNKQVDRSTRWLKEESTRQLEEESVRPQQSVLMSAYQSLLSMPDLTPEERWGFTEKGLEYKYGVDVTPEMIQQIYAELRTGNEEYILGLIKHLDSIGVPIEQFIADVIGASQALDNLSTTAAVTMQGLEEEITASRMAYRAALQDELQRLQSEQAALQAAFDTAENDYVLALRSEISETESLIERLKSVGESLSEFQQSLITGEGLLSPDVRYAQARTQLETAFLAIQSGDQETRLGRAPASTGGGGNLRQFPDNPFRDVAWAGGLTDELNPLEAIEELPELVSTFLAASRESNTDFQSYMSDFGYAQQILNDSQEIIEQQQSIEERTLENLEKQLSMVEGINNQVKSLSELYADYISAKIALDNWQQDHDLNWYEAEIARLDALINGTTDVKTALEIYQIALVNAIGSGYEDLANRFQRELDELRLLYENLTDESQVETAATGSVSTTLGFATGGTIFGPESGYTLPVGTEFHGVEHITPDSQMTDVKKELSTIKEILGMMLNTNGDQSKYAKRMWQILDGSASSGQPILVTTS